ncbi:cobalt-precorrin-5B (C(1))-methyltransferase [Amorphus orientalis]|uniref:Cobalt-precorrin-5B C(1)-methyltransferase n=1 Tax=Amorphus orientalis TaxID=649198 RepID=A0AAE3VP55_9HYPH|nr:cobalt-precorrin-5B (C(1))-methyltransferase [Amorphus orientalis]MDQ0315677.1 cobalt-precorrin-5B (C1)-methyltransferase [Amorphus orientalis]
MDEDLPKGPLRRGWTTGSCATAAAKIAYLGWRTGDFPASVPITLPSGDRPEFATACHGTGAEGAWAGVIKDAGDDPDVTHGALVIASVSAGATGSGVTFRAGEGVGTVTRPGLPIPVGEPAINPVPRQMIGTAIDEAAAETGGPRDVVVEIGIRGGAELARKTLNPRLGIVGGLSVLGTTGIVVPFSCAAWIHTIHRGIDVARAEGLTHVAGATGSTSEAAVQKLYGLPETALIDMGDFAGGMLKYLRGHPVANVTVAGGFAKMTKLGQGLLDLHSRSGRVDFDWLADRVAEAGGDADLVARARSANTASLVLDEAARAGLAIGDLVADHAWRTAARALRDEAMALEIVVFDRQGTLVGRSAMRTLKD